MAGALLRSGWAAAGSAAHIRHEVRGDSWLRLAEAELLRGEWTDPDRAKVLLRDYGEQWIRERPALRPRTVELYRWLLAKHITPHLGGVELGKLSTALIRRWRAELLASGVSESITAKCYRLLRAVLNTAANEDRVYPGEPVPGAWRRPREPGGAADSHGRPGVRTGRSDASPAIPRTRPPDGVLLAPHGAKCRRFAAVTSPRMGAGCE